jgi:hypothetical protein
MILLYFRDDQNFSDPFESKKRRVDGCESDTSVY